VPADDEVLGVAKIHLPKVGLAASLLTSPLLWLSLLVIALAIFVWPSQSDEDDDADLGHDTDAASTPTDGPGVDEPPVVAVGAAP